MKFLNQACYAPCIKEEGNTRLCVNSSISPKTQVQFINQTNVSENYLNNLTMVSCLNDINMLVQRNNEFEKMANFHIGIQTSYLHTLIN